MMASGFGCSGGDRAHGRACRVVANYNRGQPHASPGRHPPPGHDWLATVQRPSDHDGYHIVAKPVLGGLHRIRQTQRNGANVDRTDDDAVSMV